MTSSRRELEREHPIRVQRVVGAINHKDRGRQLGRCLAFEPEPLE
jgi:hypothetical protein